MTDVFKALADETRRDILLMVASKPISVNEIAGHFDMSRPAVSRHLKVLRESELISIEPDKVDGRQINCYAQLEALKEVEDYMKALEKFWKAKLGGLGKFLDKKKSREK